MDKSILSLVADNEALTKELRAILMKQFDLTALPTTVNNEHLGQIVRANLVASAGVELAFREIARHKTGVSRETQRNPAR